MTTMSLTTKLIAKILTLCGISLTCTACYGIPHPEYRMDIEGVVFDEATGDPIEGLKISSNGYPRGSAMSDKEGKFHFSQDAMGPSILKVTVEDVDGPDNGEWETLVRQVELTEKNFAPDGNGWSGHWQVEFAMKPKSGQENEEE
jgi:putative lipoprotein (rSAM/lipoprotein system)